MQKLNAKLKIIFKKTVLTLFVIPVQTGILSNDKVSNVGSNKLILESSVIQDSRIRGNDRQVYTSFLFIFAFCFLLFPFNVSFAQVMSSSNYKLESDSLNFGGGYSTSTNYIQESTGGEVATGFSSSTNYIMSAGYQQMNTVALSLVPPSSVTMSPAIGGVTGGTSNGSTNFTVTTDDPAGYTSTIQASSSPALVNTSSTTNAFADYSPAGSAPDFTFGIAATASAFAFSPQGTDADQRFRNDGISACNTGSNSTAQTCWDGLSTSAKNVADRTSANSPSGIQTTLYFRAASGSNHIQVSGVYVATTTLTILPL
jgi:hypothetical protein